MAIVQVEFVECDGCHDRVPAAHVPDIWITVQHGGDHPKQAFCSPGCCHAESDGLTPEQIVESRASRLGLSLQDVRVLRLLASGYHSKQVAAQLDMAPQSIQNEINTICRQLGVDGRLSAVLVAGHLGLVDLAAAGAQVRRDRSRRVTRAPHRQQFFTETGR